MLSYGSPCINTGTLNLPEHIELPDTDLAGNPRVYDGQIDMGAYEFGPWVGVDYQKPKSNSQQLIASPNPFYHETRIRYQSKEKGKQSIFVFDINGNKVATLMDITGHPGQGEIIWDGRNDYGRELAPGVYVVKFGVNEERMGSVKVVKK
ncbi:MAG: choice-of-anchor Q domain-containing protein [Bacteroidota bacterium]|nr:choice-of-anchor Q domain-containing protein [Bacteroidota bacterium]